MSAVLENKALDEVDAKIREREAEAHPTDTAILSAAIHARKLSGAGLHLENACPYIKTISERKECASMPAPLCIGKENYRKCPFYTGMIAQEALSGAITA